MLVLISLFLLSMSFNTLHLFNDYKDCYNTFFKYFKISKQMVFEEIYGYALDEVPGYKKLTIFKDKIGFLTIEKSKLYFWQVSITSEKKFKYLVEFPKEVNFQSYLISFDFNDSLLAIFHNQTLFIGKILTPKISLTPVKNFNQTFKFIKFIENNIYLCDYGYRKINPDSFTVNTIIKVFNLQDKSEKSNDLGTSYGFYFTLFYPPEVIDISSKFIAVSDINRYLIKVYDHFGNFLYEIKKKDPLFVEIDPKLHNAFVSYISNSSFSIKAVLDSMRTTFFSGIGIIEKINFVNDTLLLVRWWGPKSKPDNFYPDIYYDLWIVQEKQSLLIQSNILTEEPSDTTLIKCMPLYSTRYESGYNYLISFQSTPCYIKPIQSETFKNFQERRKKCKEENPRLYLRVYEYQN